jgi:hypothetical protein
VCRPIRHRERATLGSVRVWKFARRCTSRGQSLRGSRCEGMSQMHGAVGEPVTRSQDRPVNRGAVLGGTASGLFAVPPGDRGTNSWATVKQQAGQTKWSVYLRKRCYRQPGLAQHPRRFHEVPPQLLCPQRGPRRRASHWPSFIDVLLLDRICAVESRRLGRLRHLYRASRGWDEAERYARTQNWPTKGTRRPSTSCHNGGSFLQVLWRGWPCDLRLDGPGSCRSTEGPLGLPWGDRYYVVSAVGRE